MAEKLIRTYLWIMGIRFFFISFCYSTYVLFLLDNGLDYLNSAETNCFYVGVIALLEIPTGIFADMRGRKISVLISFVIEIIGFVIYFYSYSLAGFITAEIVIAIATTFSSGAFDALIKDNLDYYGYKEDIGKVFSKATMVRQFWIAVGGSLGAVIAVYDLRIQWLIASVGCFASFWLALAFIKEENFKPSGSGFSDFWFSLTKIWKQNCKYGYRNKKVWNIILISTIVMVAIQSLNMLWTPMLKQKLGIDNLSFGWFGISVFLFIGSWYAKRKVNSSNHLQLITRSVVIAFIFILASSLLTNGWLIMSAFWLHEIGRGIFTPIHSALLQNNISSKVRATVSSFSFLVSHAGAGLGLILAGIISTYASIQTSWFISSLIILSSLYFIYRIKKS